MTSSGQQQSSSQPENAPSEQDSLVQSAATAKVPRAGFVRTVFHDAYVTMDVACHGCGYNLRGLPVSGRCSECGAPVRVALAGGVLHFADPEWLGRLSRGAHAATGLLTWFGIAGLIVACGAVLKSVPSLGLLYIGWAVMIIGIVAFLRGLWAFSSPDPESVVRGFRENPCERIRAALMAVPATLVLTVIIQRVTASPYAWVWIQLLGAPFGACGLVGMLALCAHGKALAERIGDGFLFGRVNLYRRGYLVSWSIFVLGMVTQLVAGHPLIICVDLLAGVGVLGFGALILLLPTMLAGGIDAHRKAAEQIWSDEACIDETG